MAYSKPLFSINMYDNEGDVFDEGVFLVHENTYVKVSDTVKEFSDYIENLKTIEKEIKENC